MKDLRIREENATNTNRFGFSSLINRLKRSSSSTATQRLTETQDNNEFLQEALKVHNELRQKHGVEPLKLNNDLSKLAQEWGK